MSDEWKLVTSFALGAMVGGSITLNAMLRFFKRNLQKSIAWRHSVLAEVDARIASMDESP